MKKKVIDYQPLELKLKEIYFEDAKLSFIAPTWEEMGNICLNLGGKILKSGQKFDILVTLIKGGWTWSRTMADILNIPELTSFKVTYYDPSYPGKTLKEPVLESPLTIPLGGKFVLLFDDVDDTGKSLAFAKKYLSFFRAKKILTATLFHKPHSLFKPNFFGMQTNSWIIFPHEKREAFTSLVKIWSKNGLKKEKIIERLRIIGFSQKEIDLFLSL